MRRKIKKKSFFDKFSYSTRNTNIFLVVVFLLLLSGLTIGYSVLNNVLSIKGDVAIRPFKDIRITSVTGPEMTNGAYENYNFKYSHDLLVVNGVLPNTNSTLTYTITITNNGTIDMDLIDIINTCNDGNIDYQLGGIKLGDTIKAKSSVTITVTLKTSVGSNNSFNSQLQFIFEESYVDITPPEITFNPIANDEWSKDDYVVNIKATDDIAVTNFMYCVTTSTSCTPNIVIANNSDIDVTVNNSSETNTICSKASDSSKYGPNSITVCSNKDNKYYKLDKIAPTINPTLSGTLGNNGWYRSDVVINVNGFDTLSQYKGHQYQISTDNGVNYSTLSNYTKDNIIVNNECVDNKVKITGYDNALNNSSTYTSDTIKIDKTAPVITVDGHTSDYSVDYEITQEQINQKYENGTLVYYDPVKGEVCDKSEYVASNSLNENKTGCMKWYIFNDEKENTTVDMILDHNTTYKKEWISSTDYTTSNTDGTSCSYASCNDEGPVTALAQLKSDTSNWNESLIRSDSYIDPLKGYTIDYTGYKARLIEANEIAKIVGADKKLQWNSGLPYGTTVGSQSSYFCFDGTGSTYTGWRTQVANSTNKSSYAWLYDYTYGCTSYGCNTADSGTDGYWTSSASAYYSNNAWSVRYTGYLNYSGVRSTYYSVRPVITIPKSLLPSSYTLPTGSSTDNCNGNTSVTTSGTVNTKTIGSYPIKYISTDNAGNNKTLTLTVNVKDTTAPTITYKTDKTLTNNTSVEPFTLTLNITDNNSEDNNISYLYCVTNNGNDCTPNITGTDSSHSEYFEKNGQYKICTIATDNVGNSSGVVCSETYKISNPVMQSWIEGATTDFHSPTYKTKIVSVEILDNKTVSSNATASWDVSETKDGSVMAWVIKNGTTDTYNLYIGGNKGVMANQNSGFVFDGFTSITSMDLKLLDTSRTTYMGNMFRNCSSLTNLDLSNFNTSKVTSMSGMFSACLKLTNLNISSFITSKVIFMDYMFNQCSSLTNLSISNFDTSKVNKMSYMFANCSGLTTLNLNNFVTNEVTDMSYMFANCFGLTTLNLSSFNTSNVISMSNMFNSCTNINSLDLKNFNTNKVTTMSGMFGGCTKLTNLNISSFITSEVISMDYMFNQCSSLTNLSLSNFNTNKVTNMAFMFGKMNLTTLNLSNFNTENVTNMDNMFRGMTKLTSLDLSNFDTSNVTNMNSMFMNLYALTNLNVSNFNTTSATDMSHMFQNLYALTSLDLSNFNTSKVTTMSEMFCASSSLTSLDISNFDFSKVTTKDNIFSYMETNATVYVKDTKAQSWILALSTDRPSAWNTINVKIK